MWTWRWPAARRALAGPWGQLTGFGRAALMRRLAELIARDADLLAETETRDTGKLLQEMRGQVVGPAQAWYTYFAGLADKLQGETIPGRQAELPGVHPAWRSRSGWSARSFRGTRRCC